MKKTVILSVVCFILLPCVCIALSRKNNVNRNQSTKVDTSADNMATETTSESEAESEDTVNGAAKNEPEGEEEKRGNNSGNIMGGAQLAQSGEWIYYANRNDGYKIYRKKIDGSSEEKLNNVQSDYINVCDGWIYYRQPEECKIARMKTDGSSNLILYDGLVEELQYWDGYLYFIESESNGSNLYSIRTDGLGKRNILSNVSCVTVLDDWIYYLNEPYGDEKVRLYRMKIDGTEIQYPLGSIEFLTPDPVVTGEWIYFIDGKWRLCKIRTDGTELTLISRKDTTSELIVVNDWIYYDVGGCIYRMKTDGTEDTLLVEKNYIWDYCATEDALLYTYSKDKYSEEEQGELLLLDRDTSQEGN